MVSLDLDALESVIQKTQGTKGKRDTSKTVHKSKPYRKFSSTWSLPNTTLNKIKYRHGKKWTNLEIRITTLVKQLLLKSALPHKCNILIFFSSKENQNRTWASCHRGSRKTHFCMYSSRKKMIPKRSSLLSYTVLNVPRSTEPKFIKSSSRRWAHSLKPSK